MQDKSIYIIEQNNLEETNFLQEFIVFLDKELKEIICVEGEYLTKELTQQLNQEGTEIFFIQASSRKDAISKYLISIEDKFQNNNNKNKLIN